MPLALFNSSSNDRAAKKAERERNRRNQKYLREKKKREEKAKKNSKSQEELDAEAANSWAGKTLNFLNGIVDLFVPTKSRTRHDRLTKQGAVLVLCLVSLGGGMFSLNKSYKATEARKAAISSFMTSDLAWSKSKTAVSTKTKPFMTQDKKTLYIPLKMEDMDDLSSNAGDYHIFMMPKDNQTTFAYRVDSAQLVSYGSTGNMFIQINTAQPIKSQLVQFVIWSGAELTNDKYDASDDSDDSQEFVNIKNKYDTLSFTINLGGSSIKQIPKYKYVTKKTKKRVYDKDKKKHIIKTVVTKVPIPIQENSDLYDGNKLQFIYNRMVTQKKVDKEIKKTKHNYKDLQLAINKLKNDHETLKRAGYDIPDLPSWSTNLSNNLSNGIPLKYKQIIAYNILETDTQWDKTVKQKLATASTLDAKSNNEDSTDMNSDDADNEDDVDTSSLPNIKEAKTVRQITAKTPRNKSTKEKLTSSNNSDTESIRQWNDLQQQLALILLYKTQIYHTTPVKFYNMYQQFNVTTSSGNATQQKQNTGAITYSKLKGHNSHGNFMTIANQPNTKVK